MAAPASWQESAPLIAALGNPACYPHPVTRIDVLETHISWIILTGGNAYKIKKPVNLGFLDFSTLEARRHCCEEELRLNRRLAPSAYEAVVPVTGSTGSPRLYGQGAAIEYAVKMREFPQSALASQMLARGALGETHIDALAARIAAFHHETGVAARGCPYGTPEAVIAAARENFTQLARLIPKADDQGQIAELRAWTENEYQTHWALFAERHAEGWVRECHGDLHLNNIVMLDGMLTPFDCIEFDPALRWIDVMSEVAFLVMDLMDRRRPDLAWRFVNAYLEAGDALETYTSIGVLRFYVVYRSLVRAKVHALRASQEGNTTAGRERLMAASRGYMRLAQCCAHARQPAIILMHGLSGSGKSMLAQALAEDIGAIRLRSDIERKRLGGLSPLARSNSKLDSGIYAAELTLTTYHRLLDLTRAITSAGYAVVVDATFLKRWQRTLFRREARVRGLPIAIVGTTASEATLRARIMTRLASGTDASEANAAVLTHQLAQFEPLAADEQATALCIDTAQGDKKTIQRNASHALSALLAADGTRSGAVSAPASAHLDSP